MPRVALVSAVLILLPLCVACHGRPLQSQMAPGSDPRSGADAAPTRTVAGVSRTDLDRYSRARAVFEGRVPLSPVENTLERHHIAQLAREQQRRDPRISEPPPKTGVRAQADEFLANAARPSFLEPQKAYVPGELCADPVLLAVLAARFLRDPEGFLKSFRDAQRQASSRR